LPMIAGEKAPAFTLYDHTGQIGRIGPVLRAQSTRYERRGGRGAYETSRDPSVQANGAIRHDMSPVVV